MLLQPRSVDSWPPACLWNLRYLDVYCLQALNTGQQSVEETVRKVLDIIGEERPFLRAKFQRLVYQNVDASGQ